MYKMRQIILGLRSDKEKTSEFSVELIENGVRYEYGFFISDNCIVKREWLLFYETIGYEYVFDREFRKETEEYQWHFGENFLDLAQYKDYPGPNNLFLSCPVKVLIQIYCWFRYKFLITRWNEYYSETLKYLKNQDSKSKVIELLQGADPRIKDIKFDYPQANFLLFPAEAVVLCYTGENGDKFYVPLKEDSSGIREMFFYAGYILNSWERGGVLVVDDFGSSFDPKLVEWLIRSYYGEINRKDAQLVFTTSSTNFIETCIDPEETILQEDQIWIMEKNGKNESKLFPCILLPT